MDVRDFLEEKVEKFNHPSFIESDPISIPHRFTKKEDIEISAFFAATIAWGQRITIIKNATELMRRMDFAPHDFILHHSKKELKGFENFKHRTFNGMDCAFFVRSLRNIYINNGGLEKSFSGSTARKAILGFREKFFSLSHLKRTEKHISSPGSILPSGGGGACKRLNMFLRWMVRKDNRGVDFGIWNSPNSPFEGSGHERSECRGMSAKDLMCPLDVHSGNVARKLGLLSRKQNDWQSVEELTSRLREFDANDPVKYDFALFGLGVFEKF